MTALLAGYAVKFNTISDPVTKGGGYRERVRPGAFTTTLRSAAEVFASDTHNPDRLLGRRSNGTLRLAQDHVGLAYVVSVPPKVATLACLEGVNTGKLRGSSFGFRSVDEEWTVVEGVALRTINQADLFDVGPARAPLYPTSTVIAGAVDGWPTDTGTLPRTPSRVAGVGSLEARTGGSAVDPTSSWAAYVTAAYHPPYRTSTGVHGAVLRKFHTNNLDEARSFADNIATGIEGRWRNGPAADVGRVIPLRDGSVVAVLRSKSNRVGTA